VIEAARLTAVVDADTGPFESGIGRVTGAMGNLISTAGGFVLGKAFTEAPGALLNLAQGAADDAASLASLQQAVDNTGASYSDYSKQISDAVSQGQALAFSDDQVRGALQTLTQTTGSAGEAMSRLHTAEDLARGTGMDLTTASKLLGKVTDENVGVLKRYGISIEKGASAQDLLNKVDARFGGQSGKFAETAAGQWAIAKDRLSEAGESLGYVLLPAFTKVATFIAQKAVPALQSFIDTVGPSLSKGVTKATGLITRLATALRGPLMSAWVLARDAVLTFKQALSGNWADAANIRPLHKIVGEFGLLISGTVIPAVTAFAGFLTGTLWPALQQGIGFVGQLISAFQSGGLSGVLSTLMSGLASLATSVDWGAVASSIVSALGTALSTAGGVALNLVTALVTALTGVDWSGVASTIMGGIFAALSTAAGFTWDAATAVAGWIVGVDWTAVATTIATGILTAITTVAGLVWNAATTVATWIVGVDWLGVATTILTGILTAITTVAGLVWDAATTVAAWIVGVDWLGVATTILTGIRDGFLLVAGLVWDAATWVAGMVAGVDWSSVATTILSGVASALVTAQDAADSLIGAGEYWATKIAEGIKNHDWTPTTDDAAQSLRQSWDSSVDQNATPQDSESFWSKFIPDLGPFGDHLKEDIDNIISNTGRLGEQLGPLIPTSDQVSSALDGITTAAKYLGIGLGVAALVITDVFLGALGGIIGIAADVAYGLNTAADGIVNTIDGIGKGASDLVHGDWSGAWGEAKDIFRGFAEGVVQIVTYLSPELGPSLDTLKNDVVTAFTWIKENVVSTITPLPGEVGGIFTSVKDTVVSTLGGLVGDVTTIGGEIMGGLVSGLTGGIGGINGAISGAIAAIISPFAGAGSWLAGIGWDIVAGLAGGITGAADQLIDSAIKYVYDKIPGPLRKYLDSNSPSKVMMAIGSDVTAGLAIGIEDGTPEVVKASAEAAKSLIDAFNAALDLGSRILHDGVTLPAQGMIDQLQMAVSDIITGVVAVGNSLSTEGVDAAKRFGDAAKASIGWIEDALKAFDTISNSTFTEYIDNTGLLHDLLMWTGDIIAALNTASQAFTGDVYAAAQGFADIVTKSVGWIGDALDAFNTVRSAQFQQYWDDTGLLHDLLMWAEDIVYALNSAAASFNADVYAAATGLAKVVSDSVGWIADALGGFAELHSGSFSQYWDDTGLLHDLLLWASDIIYALNSASQSFSADVYTAATTFAKAVSDSVGWILDALGGFDALRSASFSEYWDDTGLLHDLLMWASDVIYALDTASKGVNTDVSAAATAFGTAVSAAVGWIADALGAFDAIRQGSFAQYWDDTGLLHDLLLWVNDVIFALNTASQSVLTNVSTAATTFAATVSASVGWIKDAIDGFNALATFDPTPVIDAAFIGLMRFVNAIRDDIALYGGLITDDVKTDTERFAATVSAAVGWISDSVDAFNALAAFDPTPNVDAAFIGLMAFVNAIKADIAVYGALITDDIKGAVEQFAATVESAVSWIIDALAAFDALSKADLGQRARQGIDNFTSITEYAVDGFRDAAGRLHDDGMTAAVAYAATASTILDVIGKASNFDALKGFSASIKDGISAFFDDVKLAVGMLIDLGRELDTGLDEAVKIAEKIAKIVSLLAPNTTGVAGGTAGGGGGSGASGGSGGGTYNPHGGGAGGTYDPHSVGAAAGGSGYKTKGGIVGAALQTVADAAAPAADSIATLGTTAAKSTVQMQSGQSVWEKTHAAGWQNDHTRGLQPPTPLNTSRQTGANTAPSPLSDHDIKRLADALFSAVRSGAQDGTSRGITAAFRGMPVGV
jgi:hypothetical protein